MKKILIATLMGVAFLPAFGQHNPQHYAWQRSHPVYVKPGYVQYVDSGSRDALVLLGLGLVIGTAVANSQQQPQPVIVQPQPVIVQPVQVCTEWRELVDAYGRIYRERICR